MPGQEDGTTSTVLRLPNTPKTPTTAHNHQHQRQQRQHQKVHKRMGKPFHICDPGGIQTHDFRNRNPTFYSAELRGQMRHNNIKGGILLCPFELFFHQLRREAHHQEVAKEECQHLGNGPETPRCRRCRTALAASKRRPARRPASAQRRPWHSPPRCSGR